MVSFLVLFWHAAEILGFRLLFGFFAWSVSELVECGTACCAPHPSPHLTFLCSPNVSSSLCFVSNSWILDLKYVKSLVVFYWPRSWLWILFLGKGGWGGRVGGVVEGGNFRTVQGFLWKKCKNLLALPLKGGKTMDSKPCFSFGLTFSRVFTRSCYELWVDFFVLGT